MDFQDNTQRLLSQKIETENKLSAVQKELAETQAQFKESFNVLYPAFVAVENIRYIGADTNTYHRFDCILFSEYESYTAHNTEQCELLGYTPCPVCCN